VLEEQGVNYRQTLYTPIVWCGHGCLKSSIRQKFKQCGESSHRLVSCSRRGGSLSRYRSQQPANACPVSVETLFKRTEASQAEVKPEQRWCGRRVKAYDSTTVTMSDTCQSASYPQHSNQLVGWLSVGKSGGVVLCDNWSSPGSCDGRVYHE